MEIVIMIGRQVRRQSADNAGEAQQPPRKESRRPAFASRGRDLFPCGVAVRRWPSPCAEAEERVSS